MRKRMSGAARCAGAAICLALLFLPAADAAAGESAGYSVLKFGGGIVSAFLVHEAAHGLVSLATGTDLHWKAGDMNQPIAFREHGVAKATGLALYSSGMLFQAAGAEILLQCDRVDKNDYFVRGMMLWNIINPVTYSLDYWFIRRSNSTNGTAYQGDLQGMEHYSSRTTANVFAATMLAVAAFQGYRYVKTQSWAPDWLKGRELDKVALSPLPSGGAMLSYRAEF